MSTTYIAVIIGILAQVLPMLGIQVGTEQLTNATQVIVTIVTGLWVLKNRYQLGGITLAGVRKN